MVTPALRAVAVRPVGPLIEARFIYEAVGDEYRSSNPSASSRLSMALMLCCSGGRALVHRSGIPLAVPSQQVPSDE
jgi:hypothetical protein